MSNHRKCPVCGVVATVVGGMPPCGCDYSHLPDSLIAPAEPDRFTTESPIRAFTEFRIDGKVAIGKGFRPSLAHIGVYLNALEEKEGWRLVQLLDGGTLDPTLILRRVHVDPVMPEVKQRMTVMRPEMVAPFGTIHPAKAMVNTAGDDPRDKTLDAFRARQGETVDDLGAPHGVLLRVMVRSNFNRLHESSALYDDGSWYFITHMRSDGTFTKSPMRGSPTVWKRQTDEEWSPPAVQTYVAAIVAAATDDPINPPHYAGTACAEIGELLTANSFQVLRYNWRLGKKDEAKQELGKSIWYIDREIALTPALTPRLLPDHCWFDERLRHADPHAANVARILISWNRYGSAASLIGLRKILKSMRDKAL